MNNILVLIERYLWLELTVIGEHLALARMMYEKRWSFNWGRAENGGVAQVQQDDVSNSRGCKRALLTFLFSFVQKTVDFNPGLNNKRCLHLAGLQVFTVWSELNRRKFVFKHHLCIQANTWVVERSVILFAAFRSPSPVQKPRWRCRELGCISSNVVSFLQQSRC